MINRITLLLFIPLLFISSACQNPAITPIGVDYTPSTSVSSQRNDNLLLPTTPKNPTFIAVVDFTGNNVSEGDCRALTDRLRAELFNTKYFKVIEREMMEEIIKEQGFQQSGCSTDECMVEVGKLIGVEKIVGGSISQVGNIYSVSARIVNVETGEIENTGLYDLRGNIGELLTGGMKKVALELIGVKNIETNLSDLAPARSKSQEEININYNPSFTPTYNVAEYKAAYMKALQKFQNQEFDGAINIFRNLSQSNRVTALTDNSQYWIAECYYAKKEFKRAIAEFEKVFTYSGTDKGDDSQLKIGLSYQAMGNVIKAREEFQRLIDYYPGSEYYPKAMKALKQLSIN